MPNSSYAPITIGAAALADLDESGPVVRPYKNGVYGLTGEFFILASQGQVFSGYNTVDMMYSWADSAQPLWRHFMLQPGATMTILLQNTAWIGAANPVTDQTIKSKVYDPPWLSKTSVGISSLGQSNITVSTGSFGGTTGSPRTITPQVQWWDVNILGTPGVAWDLSLQPAMSDIVFDQNDRIGLTAGPSSQWSLYQAGAPLASNSYNLIPAAPFLGDVTFSPNTLSEFITEFWFVLLSGLVVSGKEDMFSFNAGTPPAVDAVTAVLAVGPILVQRSTGVSLQVSVHSPDMPGQQMMSFGTFIAVPDTAPSAGLQSPPFYGPLPGPPAWLYSYAANTFRRQAQTLVGSANRAT